MSILAALTIIPLFFGFSFSQLSYPSCTSAEFTWTYNSLNQNPCAVAAYLEATCNKGVWTFEPLPTGYHYGGPNDYWRTDLCMCNSILYSLVSACDACQGDPWSTWPEWAYNCTQTLPPSTFPNPIPDGTRVPHWALLDITIENNWNPNKSKTAGDSPEISPGVLITASSSSSAPSKASTTGTSQSSTATGASSPNTGFIVAGIVGGVAVITIAVVVIFFLRRQRARASSDMVAAITEDTAQFAVGGAPQPKYQGKNALSDDVTLGSSTMPDSPTTPMGVYNPNNAATLPEPQDPNAPHLSVQALLDQYQAPRNTLASMHVSRQQGYENLPGV